ncbi:MAG TPA: hypothetical protein VG406_19130 [Isosphaeraceae bacterium]|jgi:hypothetical protein|nr:hypothetical protein [Isosphaeraceae bacterium]
MIDPKPPATESASPELAEFMEAMRRYRESSGRMFPTWSEVLEVLRGLGYEKPKASCDQRECA